MKDRFDSKRCSKFLKALADPDRLKIVQYLLEGPRSVGEISRHLRSPLANASHHLKQLRIAGVIRPRKQGRKVLYSIAPDVAAGKDSLHVLEFGGCRLELGGREEVGHARTGVNDKDVPAAYALLALATLAWSSSATGTLLPVANPSFELPKTGFVSTEVTGWTIAGPAETGIAGVFNNNSTAAGSPARILNPDGNQLAFMSSETGNELSQVLSGTFEAGRAYTLCVGVAQSYTKPPKPTDRLRIALFYNDGATRQIVAQSDIFNDAGADLSPSVIKYFTACTPVLAEGEPAVGRPIGILLAAVGEIGGYFNMESVTVRKGIDAGGERRLAHESSVPESAALLPVLVSMMLTRKRSS